MTSFHPNLRTKIKSPRPSTTNSPKLSLKSLCRIASTVFQVFIHHSEISKFPQWWKLPTKSHDFMPLLENSLKSPQMLKLSLMSLKAQMLIKCTIIQLIISQNNRLLSLIIEKLKLIKLLFKYNQNHLQTVAFSIQQMIYLKPVFHVKINASKLSSVM